MRVRVNDELCQGHGLCRLSAPDLFFAREEDGNAYVKDENVPARSRGRRPAGGGQLPGTGHRGLLT